MRSDAAHPVVVGERWTKSVFNTQDCSDQNSEVGEKMSLCETHCRKGGVWKFSVKKVP